VQSPNCEGHASHHLTGFQPPLCLFQLYVILDTNVAPKTQVTVFDFSMILERTERRVRDDLLGVGPKTVDELRSIAGRLRLKYQNQLDRRIQRAEQQQQRAEAAVPVTPTGGGDASSKPAQQKVSDVMAQAGTMAGGLFSKIRPPTIPSIQIPSMMLSSRKAAQPLPPQTPAHPSPNLSPTIVALPPLVAAPAAVTDLSASGGIEGDWIGTDIPPVTDAICHFSIGDDDDDDL
jgi:hypothetical protein